MKEVIIGEYYRHKDTPNYAFAKVLEILKPKQHPNTLNCKVAKCEWVINKGDKIGMIKHFKVKDLVRL